jgi:hypothetical protein
MMEIIFAIGLMALLSACFFASLGTVRDMAGVFTEESRARLVLDNTVERLSGAAGFSPDELRRVFLDEYGKSCLADNSALKPEIRRDGACVCPSIIKKNGKPLAELRIKCEKQ